MTSRDEQRQAVLGRLATHTERIQWASPSSPNAFADDVLELADRIRRTTDTTPPPLRGAGATRRAIDEAHRTLAEALAQVRTDTKETP